MKKRLVLPIVMLLLGFGLNAQAASDARNLQTTGGAKRVALVIGNDHYRSVTPLKNAVADARSMAKALEQAGFAVTLKSDADLGTMKQSVRQFKAKLSGGDEAVFFYSGHGVQLGAANYLLPVDITSDSEEQVKDDAIPLQRLLDDLQDQKVKFALAIIDACRDNPFKAAGKRSIGNTRGLAATSAANGQMVIFSAGAGQQALDKLGTTDRNENGVFTRVFLQEMQKPGVEVHQVLRSVRSRVVQMARSVNHDQMPALYDQVEGDFYFKPGSGTQVASLEPVSAPARVKSKEQIEDEYWDTINDSTDLASFEQYRNAYPKGRYALLAQARIAKLKKEAAQAAANGPQPRKAFKDCPDCPEMVAIPAGSFEMGSNNGEDSEIPVHRVTLRSFALGKTEVTQGQWKAIMGSNPSKFTSCGDDCPVEQVSWGDAQDYIQKLNARTGKRYRLPSEAEWEYACRAGGKHEYCGSDNLDSVGWYGAKATPLGNSAKTTNRVATKQANAFALYDMSGNVWEWVEDSYHDTYNGSPVDGSAWSGDGAVRVTRGSSWNFKPQEARSANRDRIDASSRYDSVGFRLARMLP